MSRNVRDGDTQLGHFPVRGLTHSLIVHWPDPEYLSVWPKPSQASHGVVEVDVCVIRQVVRIVGALRRVQGNQHAWSSGRLFQADSIIVNVGRQLTVGQLLTGLSEQQIRIGIQS